VPSCAAPATPGEGWFFVKIVTWNVNSLNARADYVGRFLDAEAPDVLAIQELKMEAAQVPRELFESRGYHLAMHAQPRWNGVLIASKAPISDVMAGLPAAEEDEARIIAATTFGVRFVDLYCPQGQAADSPKFAYKLRFYDGLIAWLRGVVTPDAPWVVLGDLNIAPCPEDIWDPAAFAGVPSFHPEEHARWAELVSFGLRDVVVEHTTPPFFTFWDYRGGAFHRHHGMRIDHVLTTAPVAARVTDVAVPRDWRKKVEGLTPSDHAPLVVILAE
jgi:exodeoxyribonuclease-3